jgi:hypothetical protein
LILKSEETHRPAIGGGKVVLFRDLLAINLRELSDIGVSSAMVPEQWPLILTLQFAAEDRRQFLLGGTITQVAATNRVKPV